MKMPIRVAQILSKMDNGGIEQVVLNYYTTIDKTKVQFDFFVDENSVFEKKDEVLAMGAKIYFLPSIKNVFKYQKMLKAVLSENKYTIAHAHMSTLSVFPIFAAYRAKIPVRICHSHSTASWAEPKKTILKYILRPFSNIFATHYFGCGTKAAKFMFGKNCFNKRNFYLQTNAIDMKKFAFSAHNAEEIRKEFNIGKNDFVLGNIGRLCTQKNHTFLLKVFAKAIKQNKNAKLLIVGDGELKGDLCGEIERLGIKNSVILAGNRNDVHKFYSAFDVFCLPSNFEGMPVVFAECVANGLKFVCSDKVSDEVLMYKNAKMLSLKSDTTAWAKEFLQSERIDDERTINKYDIASAASELCKKYINLNAGS